MSQLTADERQQRRIQKDRFARYLITLGGIGVIIAILTIFFYLASVVIPLFLPPTAHKLAEYSLEQGGTPLFMALDEQSEYAIILNQEAQLIYFDAKTGVEIERFNLAKAGKLTALGVANYETGLMALGYENGQVLVISAGFKVTYPDRRVVKPLLEFPYGEQPLPLSPTQEAIKELAIRHSDTQLTVAATTPSGKVHLTQWTKQVSFLDEDEFSLERHDVVMEQALVADFILIDPNQRHLFLLTQQRQMHQYQIENLNKIKLLEAKDLEVAGTIEEVEFLIGGISLLIGTSQGELSQWFNIRNSAGEPVLSPIRRFSHQPGSGVASLASELRRKGMLTGDRLGNVTLFHSTAERTVLELPVSNQPIQGVAPSPRANSFLAVDGQQRYYLYAVDNEYPEVSWSALWSKVHYEGYQEPSYVWQSSAANNDFEPKYSLAPLAFGTLKAAFYAMLVAVPLSILGAIYTAYFMSPTMRQMVKPTIEIMEALPTVILGFLAGLWLAPLIEHHLPGFFALLLLTPAAFLAASYGWERIPQRWRERIPEGWEAALLIPVLLLALFLSMGLSSPLENLLFQGDMRQWLNQNGVTFDQRNSIIVGIAMGFAVIPTIFSMAEDAIFSVPKHLTFGSLALGATPWQTMLRVVLLTASPGIFAAVMIGLGRAVGETMIVLMSTGNTPVMNFNLFEGMRTLSANIAVEMPESEVDSTHYRILFLAALVLLIFTFVFNTVAEVVRHRLRKKYSSL